MTPVRLEPAALRSRVKHSTTETLRSPKHGSATMLEHVTCIIMLALLQVEEHHYKELLSAVYIRGYLTMFIYIQFKFHESPSIGYLVIAEDRKNH